MRRITREDINAADSNAHSACSSLRGIADCLYTRVCELEQAIRDRLAATGSPQHEQIMDRRLKELISYDADKAAQDG
jgi:hypothetical protein